MTQDVQRYAVVLRQAGGPSCSRSIGCGTHYHPLQATTLADAMIEARLYIQGPKDPAYNCGYAETQLLDWGRDPKLHWAQIVRVAEDLPVVQWHQEVLAEWDRLEALRLRPTDEAELTRLAEKLGKEIK